MENHKTNLIPGISLYKNFEKDCLHGILYWKVHNKYQNKQRLTQGPHIFIHEWRVSQQCIGEPETTANNSLLRWFNAHFHWGGARGHQGHSDIIRESYRVTLIFENICCPSTHYFWEFSLKSQTILIIDYLLKLIDSKITWQNRWYFELLELEKQSILKLSFIRSRACFSDPQSHI